MLQALEHPYIAQFHDPQLETVADEIINIQLSDNVKVMPLINSNDNHFIIEFIINLQGLPAADSFQACSTIIHHQESSSQH